MINIFQKFDTEEDAKIWSEDYLKRYHPCGYDTVLNKPLFNDVENVWIVRGSRYSSCD
jgi:hypothetical protein